MEFAFTKSWLWSWTLSRDIPTEDGGSCFGGPHYPCFISSWAWMSLCWAVNETVIYQNHLKFPSWLWSAESLLVAVPRVGYSLWLSRAVPLWRGRAPVWKPIAADTAWICRQERRKLCAHVVQPLLGPTAVASPKCAQWWWAPGFAGGPHALCGAVWALHFCPFSPLRQRGKILEKIGNTSWINRAFQILFSCVSHHRNSVISPFPSPSLPLAWNTDVQGC